MIINYIKNYLIRNEYVIAYRSVKEIEDSLIYSGKVHDYKVLAATNNWWYADPLLFTQQGDIYLFMEAYDRRLDIGRIAVSRYENDTFTEPKVVLEEPFHLSFPVVFERNGKIYMIPESSAANSLRIYQADGELYHWQLIKSIPVKDLVDACLLSYGGEYYLLGSVLGDNPICTKEVFYKLNDEFELEQPQSVEYICEEGFGVRNAGKVLNVSEDSILPKQVSYLPNRYGISTDLYRIEINNGIVRKQKIKGITADRINIGKYYRNSEVIGTHTYDCEAGIEVVDLNMDVVRGINFWREFQKSITRMFKKVRGTTNV